MFEIRKAGLMKRKRKIKKEGRILKTYMPLAAPHQEMESSREK